MKKRMKRILLASLLILAIGTGIYCIVWTAILSAHPYQFEYVPLQLPVLDAENQAKAEELEERYGKMTVSINCRRCVTVTNGQGQTLSIDPKKGLSGNLLVYSAKQGKGNYDFEGGNSLSLVLCGSDKLAIDFDGQKGWLGISGTAYGVPGSHLGQITYHSDGRIQIVDNSLFGSNYEVGIIGPEDENGWYYDVNITGRIKGAETIQLEAPSTIRFQGNCKKWKFVMYVIDWCKWLEETIEVPTPDAEVEYFRRGDAAGHTFAVR